MTKKLLSIISILCVLLGMFSLCVSAEETANVTEIGTADELIALMNDNTKWSAENNYILTDNIDLTGETDQKPIGDGTGSFYGTFNGGGHYIEGINISGEAGRVALFGSVAGATIENLTIYGEITGGNGQGIGGLVGISDKGTTIRNCVNYCNVTSTTHAESCAGGIVGFLRVMHADSNVTIENCKNYGTINATSYTGGLIGRINITNATVAATSAVTVSECANYGLVKSESSKAQYIGGLIGHIIIRAEQDVTIERCLNAGNVNIAYRYTGGIIGFIYVPVASGIIINDCMNTGDIYAESGYVGGLFGYHDATNKYKSVTTNFYNRGEVSAGSSANASYIMPITGVPRLSEFNNAYYLDDGITDSRGTKVSAAESVLADTFTGFSGDVWIIAKNGPELKTFHTHDFSGGVYESTGTKTHVPVCYCGEHGNEAAHVDEDTNKVCDICEGVVSCDHGSTVKTWETVSESTCSIQGVERERCACGELTGNTRNLDLDTSAHINLDYVWSKNAETSLYEIVCPDCNVAVNSQAEKPTVYLTPSSLDPTGITPETGVTDLISAVEKIAATGGTVWITENYTISGETITLPTYTETITIRGNVGDSGLTTTGIFNNTTAYLYLGGPTVFDKIVFKGVGTTADANKAITYIIANWNDLTLDYIRNIENAQAYIVAGQYNITESNNVAKEITVNLTGVSKVSGTTNNFYSHVYLGDIFNASGISSSDKKVTLNVKKGINHEATIDFLYTRSTSVGSNQDCLTPGTETVVNLYDGTSILRGRTSDSNVCSEGSTGHMDKLTLNFYDNSIIGGTYQLKNIKETIINISTVADGRTATIAYQFVAMKYGDFGTVESKVTVKGDSHGSKSSEPARITSDSAATGTAKTNFDFTNITDVCTWDEGAITTEPTPSSDGVMTYTCTVCGKTKTTPVPFVCTEHIYVVKADGTYYCANGCEVETPTAPVIVSLAPAAVNGNEVTLTVSVNAATPIVTHGFKINAPEGFTLKSINGLLPEATTTAIGWTLTGQDNTTTPCNFAIFNMSMTDNAINSAVVELVFTVADTVEYGTYVFTVDSIETYNYDEEAIETVSLDAEVVYTVYGDIDLDGDVDILDVLKLVNAVVNDKPVVNGDLNGDGKVSLIDVIRVLNLVAQL